MHLIYKSKNYETNSKDYDFSHVAMVEHWNAGVRDVHLSMRHKEWLERPQSGGNHGDVRSHGGRGENATGMIRKSVQRFSEEIMPKHRANQE